MSTMKAARDAGRMSREARSGSTYTRVGAWALLILGVSACGAAPSLRGSVGDALGDPIDVSAVMNLCDLPVGTPVTASIVFLGCTDGKIPVLLDTVCQAHSTTGRSCAYAVEPFANPLAASGTRDTRLLQP